MSLKITMHGKITFGKFKGKIPYKLLNSHRTIKKEFLSYVMWAYTNTEIEISGTVLELAKKKARYDSAKKKSIKQLQEDCILEVRNLTDMVSIDY